MHVCFLTPAYGASGGMVGRHVEALAAGVVRDAGTAEVLVYGGRTPESHAGRASGSRALPDLSRAWTARYRNR